MMMLAVEERRKEAIRGKILGQRDELSAEQRLDKSNIISVRVVQTWEFQQAGSVMLYASFGSEVDTNWLMQATLEADKRLILPALVEFYAMLALLTAIFFLFFIKWPVVEAAATAGAGT